MPKNFKSLALWMAFLACFLVCMAINPVSGAKAKCWDVYPSWTRLSIQATVDGASNGDTILFHAGTYDWSDTPLSQKDMNTGAIQVIDKSLKIKGEKGTLLIGPQSNDLPDPVLSQEGVNAFNIIDLGLDDDVVFDHLSFQTFLRGIRCGFGNEDPIDPVVEPNMRNLTIANCTFSDIHRDAISISYIGGNVLIQNNDMTCKRIAVFCDWYWSLNHQAWQPENTCIRILDNNIIIDKNSPRANSGLYFQQTTNVIVMKNKISAPSGIDMGGTGAVISGNSLTDCLQGMDLYLGPHGMVIEQNELKNIADYGIRLHSTDSQGNIVRNNSLVMADTSWAGIVSNANNNYYGQNKISGTGGTAFYLFSSDWGSAYKETLQANNVDNFIPTYCHFYLGPSTHDNLIVGSGMDHNTYDDYGYNNRITGVTPLAGGIGQDIIDAIHRRNEESKQARKVIY